jgi:hypothetical protein
LLNHGQRAAVGYGQRQPDARSEVLSDQFQRVRVCATEAVDGLCCVAHRDQAPTLGEYLPQDGALDLVCVLRFIDEHPVVGRESHALGDREVEQVVEVHLVAGVGGFQDLDGEADAYHFVAAVGVGFQLVVLNQRHEHG